MLAISYRCPHYRNELLALGKESHMWRCAMTPTTTAYVPSIPDTDWSPSGDIYKAPATDAFWRLYRVGKGHLYDVGIRCTMEDRDWVAIYTPGKATPEEIERVLLKVDDAAMMEEAAIQRERDRIAEEKRLKDEEKRREYQAWLADNAEEMKALQAEAKELLAKYKQACAQAASMPGWINNYPLSQWSYFDLRRAVDATRKKITKFDNFEGFSRRCKFADWPHEKIAAGVRHLTAADGDNAELQNDRGWSKADTSAGHYLNALLATHYDDAVERARYIIGAYEKQLRKAGII